VSSPAHDDWYIADEAVPEIIIAIARLEQDRPVGGGGGGGVFFFFFFFFWGGGAGRQWIAEIRRGDRGRAWVAGRPWRTYFCSHNSSRSCTRQPRKL